MVNESAANGLSVLIVDDEANIRRTLSYCLEDEGHGVVAVSNPSDALAAARRGCVDIVFLDLRLGAADGMDLIRPLLAESPWVKIIVITAHASIESAVEAIRQGAEDYIPKPFTPDQVRLITRRIGRLRALEAEVAVLRENLSEFGPFGCFQSRNPGMQRLIETTRRAAASDAIILLRGESGTGKSVFARAIHQWSRRAGKPMAVVSCPSVPAELLESELFGHVRGAFTGALRDNPGRIVACEGGTLLLDEIADLAPAVQAKLLRFIQDREYERLGDATPRKADVRILAATNAAIESRVAEGHFREDLFYRLNVISLTIPPLRERPEDILPLAMDFLAHFSKANHRSILGFTEDAMTAMTRYAWPGNVRELRNAVERAVILGSDTRIEREDLPHEAAPAAMAPSVGDFVSLSLIEELHIRLVLARTSSLQEAADILGINQATLWRRRKTYGI
ncbi:MAG: sigma-54-dependent Fis family transcriptional regulator [Lentisphaeria bacterium]|nr:sigma-54-dependent Fis family transcriptional regulator [Lentisphaeria bacterium]